MKVCPSCQETYDASVDYCPADGMKLRRQRGEEEDPMIGRVLDGRWVIESMLGEGGMGAVYRAHQRSVDRTVAIKTLRPALVDSDEFIDRFFREAQIATKINHPHCVTILDFGQTEDDVLFLAMEYLEGDLLTDRMTGGLSVADIIKVGLQVASALAAAHDVNIVHRDLKPDNIFLLDIPGGGIFVKVLDFGIAKMLDANTQVTKTGMIFGTPEYMSPEQCRGTRIDGRSDLYSLGCILYELIGGRTPFASTTPMAVLMAHVNEDPPDLDATTRPDVPRSLENVVMKLLAKDPDLRYETAMEVREALEGELSALEGGGPPVPLERDEPSQEVGFDPTLGIDNVDVEERPTPETSSGVPASSVRGRGPLVAIAAIVLALVAIAGLITYSLLQDDVAQAEPTDTATQQQPSTASEETEAKNEASGETVAAKVREESPEGSKEESAPADESADELNFGADDLADVDTEVDEKGADDEQPAEQKNDSTPDDETGKASAPEDDEEERAQREAKKKKEEEKKRRKKRRKIEKSKEKGGKSKKELDSMLDGLMRE